MNTTEPIRLVHFADIHIGMENYGQIDPATGVNQRVLDFIRRLRQVVDFAMAHDADVALFCGDAFKTRDPSPTLQREFAREVMRLANAGIQVILLVGNHDIPIMDKRASSVEIYRTLAVANVYVGNKEQLITVQTKHGPLQVGIAPWPVRSRLMQLTEFHSYNMEQLDREMERILDDELTQMALKVDPTIPAVLAAHFTVSGATFGSERSVMVGKVTVVLQSLLKNSAWDYVAMGHIHKHQIVNPNEYPEIVYSGSLERIDFGEEREPKGFCWVEVTRNHTQWSFIHVDARPFVTIDVDATQDADTPTDAVLRAIARTECVDAVVRIRVKLLQAQEPLFKQKEVEKALSEVGFFVGITKDIQRETRTRIGLQKAESLSADQLLHEYFVSKNSDPVQVAALMEIAKVILNTPKVSK